MFFVIMRKGVYLMSRAAVASACFATVAILSLGQVSAWMAPSFGTCGRNLLSRQAASTACRRAGHCSGALRMNVEETEAPKKGKTRGNKLILGPGLFDPNIPVGSQVDEVEEKILLPRSKFTALFNKYDKNQDGWMDRDDLMIMVKELGEDWTLEQAVQAVWMIDPDHDGFMSVEDLFNTYQTGYLSKVNKQPVSKEVKNICKNVHSLSKADVENFFQLQDNDANELLDLKEMTELLISAGFELEEPRTAEIYAKIADKNGKQGVTLASFYAWLSSGFDLQGVNRKFSEVILAKTALPLY